MKSLTCTVPRFVSGMLGRQQPAPAQSQGTDPRSGIRCSFIRRDTRSGSGGAAEASVQRLSIDIQSCHGACRLQLAAKRNTSPKHPLKGGTQQTSVLPRDQRIEVAALQLLDPSRP